MVRAPMRQYRLTFVDKPDYAGVEVVARAPTVGETFEVNDLKASPLGIGMHEGSAQSWQRILEIFADALVSWNLEGEYAVLPLSVESLKGMDPQFVYDMIVHWAVGPLGVDDDLGKDSTSGEPFPEGSIPMELPSSSLSS